MEAVQALQQGKIDAVIIDNQPAKTFVEENEGLKILETSYVEEDYALAIKKVMMIWLRKSMMRSKS